MKGKRNEQLDKTVTYGLKQLKEMKVMLRDPVGEQLGEQPRRKGSLAIISSIWDHVFIYHRLFHDGPSVHFLRPPGIYYTPRVEGVMSIHHIRREARIPTDPKVERRRISVLACRGYMYQGIFGTYKRFMNTTAIAAIGFFRYF